MTKHTPGPWFSEKGFRDGTWKVFEITDNQGLLLAEVIKNGDARLIAAAPDLLAVLEELLPDLQCRCDVAFTSRGRHQPNTFCHHEDDVKAAIAKARGEKP